MKKTLFSAILAVLVVAGIVWADATFTSTVTPKAAKLDYLSGGAVAVTDASQGYTQNVDSDGHAAVLLKGQTISSQTGSTLNTGTALYTGACRVSSVTCSGLVTGAGDYVLIYDNTSATGTPKFECTLGVAKDTNSISVPGGAVFSTGIYAASNDDDVHVAVTYDY